MANGAESWYQGVQIEWVKRYSGGTSFSVSYTRSVSEDTTSEATFVGAGDTNQLGPNAKYAKGYSRFHTPHRFTVMGTYEVPSFAKNNRLLDALLGGWQLSGTFKLASGTPFTVSQTGIDLNFDGFSEGRPVLLDPSILYTSVDDPAKSKTQLPLAAFRATTIADTEDMLVGRNTFFGDGLVNLDLGLYKSFRLPSGHTVSLRVQAFNVTNYVQDRLPGVGLQHAGDVRVDHGHRRGVHPADDPAQRLVQVLIRYSLRLTTNETTKIKRTRRHKGFVAFVPLVLRGQDT